MNINKLKKIKKQVKRTSAISASMDLDTKWIRTAKECEFNKIDDDIPECCHEDRELSWCDALTCPLLGK